MENQKKAKVRKIESVSLSSQKQKSRQMLFAAARLLIKNAR